MTPFMGMLCTCYAPVVYRLCTTYRHAYVPGGPYVWYLYRWWYALYMYAMYVAMCYTWYRYVYTVW